MSDLNPTNDTSYYIWEPLFRCRVPQLQTTSPEYLRHFGSHTTGDDAIDRALAGQMVETMLPIAKMVEYHKKGIPVSILFQKDIKKIYEYIENHILAWKTQLSRGVNIGGAPIDDLVAMDAFANTVYVHAKHMFDRKEADTILTSHMSGVLQITAANIFRPKVVEIGEEEQLPERNSLADSFKEQKVGRNKWR